MVDLKKKLVMTVGTRHELALKTCNMLIQMELFYFLVQFNEPIDGRVFWYRLSVIKSRQ